VFAVILLGKSPLLWRAASLASMGLNTASRAGFRVLLRVQ
jgi:hypothetical protein